MLPGWGQEFPEILWSGETSGTVKKSTCEVVHPAAEFASLGATCWMKAADGVVANQATRCAPLEGPGGQGGHRVPLLRIFSFLQTKIRLAVLWIPCTVSTRTEWRLNSRTLADAAASLAAYHLGQGGVAGAATNFYRLVGEGEGGVKELNISCGGIAFQQEDKILIFYRLQWWLPGHSDVMQSSTSLEFPAHCSLPPTAGSLHSRALNLKPCPQEAQHWDHPPHCCHSVASPNKEILYVNVIFFNRILALYSRVRAQMWHSFDYVLFTSLRGGSKRLHWRRSNHATSPTSMMTNSHSLHCCITRCMAHVHLVWMHP